MIDLNILNILILFISAFFAGFVDSIAGGGGIITIPTLLILGLPPHFAIATNKLQAVTGSFTSSFNYIKNNLTHPNKFIEGIIFTGIGAILGTYTITLISDKFLNYIIIILLAIVLIIYMKNPHIGKEKKSEKMSKKVFFIIFGLCLGFYDGFFGPATGTFWTLSLIFFLGKDLKSATANTKIMNFTSNIISLFFFIPTGFIIYQIGFIMMGGQILGALIGSNTVVKKEINFIRNTIIIVVFIILLKLINDNFLHII